MKIPLFLPWITKDDIHTVSKTLKNPQLTDGSILRKFESKFAKITNSKYAVGVSNGTEALHLSLISCDIGPGDEVIVPDFTFIATANAVVSSGAKPILADIDESLNISIDSIKKRITSKTKAIIPVHFGGLSCNIREIKKIARKHNLKIIEDCAHAFGTFENDKHVGTFGESGCFSFYPTKNITTIEGGMIITDSKKLYTKLTSLRNHGLNRSLLDRNKSSFPWEYDLISPGYNFRLDEVRSALGVSQLSRYSVARSKRVNAAKYYNSKLKNISGINIVNFEKTNLNSFHMYIVRITKEFGISRNLLHKKLFSKGIQTTIHYKPLHNFSYYSKSNKSNLFPNSSLAYSECLTLPLFPTITKKQQDYVIENILKYQK